MTPKLRKKLEKLYKLATNGVDGERLNAEKFLNNLLIKHGLSIADLDDEHLEEFWFKHNQGEHYGDLMSQIIRKVTDGRPVYINKYKRNHLCVEVTNSEKVEIELLYSAYKVALDEEFEKVKLGFIMKHDLFPKTKSENNEPRTLTREELLKYKQAGLLSEFMPDVNVNKQIGAN